MTREDALMAMNGATLIGVADKLGVKAACNKTRTALKEAKANVIARILEAEAALAAKEAETEKPEAKEAEVKAPEEETQATQEAETPATTEPAAEPEAPTKEIPAATPEKKPEKKKAEKKAKAEKKVQEPAQEPAEIVAAVTALDDIFDKLNDMYFDSLLPKADITVRRTNRTYDCCSVKKGEAEGQYDIEVCTSAIGKPIKETAASLLHAMVHLYCMEMDITETCQKGRYHNGKFKRECEDRDLVVEYDSANGFVHTMPSELFGTNLKNAGLDLDMQLAAIPAKKKSTERA